MRFALVCAVLLAGCTQFPELDETATPGVAEAPYPRLVPLETLLTAPAPRATPEVAEAVEGRVERLRGQADRLKSVQVAQAGSVPDRVDRLRRRAEALRAQ